MDMQKFIKLISESEEILMEKILGYAKQQGYVQYTSTLKEAWRMSIAGLSEALLKVARKTEEIPEMRPEDDFGEDEIAEFGIKEAQKHRSRGITIGMFLALMKYYQQAYLDLVEESDFSAEEKRYFCQYIKRYFDHVELGFIIEWSGLSEKQKIEELQAENRKMTNEKNKYLTVFESIYDPIILVDTENKIENINSKAAEMFLNEPVVPGTNYYNTKSLDEPLKLLNEELLSFADLKQNEISIEKTMNTKVGERTYIIKFKKMLDFSEKYEGTVILFNDITPRIEAEKKLKSYQSKLEFYAFTDSMTGVPNRRTGIMILEKELMLAPLKDGALALCYLDVDGLKHVNDSYGHAEGDSMLQTIVSAIEVSIRNIDLLSRMGGDEFLIIFPGCREEDADQIMKRITEKLDEYDKTGAKPFKHEFSYGIVAVDKESERDTNELIKAADQKMYAQKLKKRAEKNKLE